MLFLLASSLRRGHSGVRAELVELVLALLERGVTPVDPEQGLGRLVRRPRAARAPRARADRRGRGDVRRRRAARRRGARARRPEPVALTAKEGLAIINGTHLMAAAGALAVRDAQRLLDAAVVAVALSLEAFKGSTVPFDARLHELRRQPGPAAVAARLRALLARQPGGGQPRRLRPRPGPVHAALRAAGARRGRRRARLRRAARSSASSTPSPTTRSCSRDDGDILSGGNFHGQPLSLPLDHLALALCELASFSERRIYALLSPGYAGLPPFLTPRPGLSSGLMIAQYAAAALVNECQVLSHPAGAGSIPTSAGQEDFNSMGALAALKARTVIENAAHVVATELVCAAQGLEFHRPLRTTPALEEALARVREHVPRVEEDRSLAGELAGLADALRTGELVLA